ncbi:murein L,D-transpeptidase catalytic domain family protein [uncultured Hymenobacter sp.]|uniref:murein L,D-transpeptidase catalytic domain family protein n=1 Tax=uncultured Hymenobacter sp. TaxID=170016 RepID=UPI0035CBC8FB
MIHLLRPSASERGVGAGRGLAGAVGLLVALLLALLAGCQARADETRLAAGQSLPPAAVADTVRSARPAPLPDSLALTPVLPLPGLTPALRQAIGQLHDALGPEAADLRPEVLTQACVGYLALRQQDRAQSWGAVLAVADLDLPNTTPRLWVIDLKARKVLHRSLVAHGRGSGHLRARRFSGQLKSACSALGFYRTLATYEGKNGLSRRLRGLDPGQNTTAEDRYVVLHGADYAGPEYVAKYGHLGYSRGCPALPPRQYAAIIRALPAGRVLLLSGPGLASRWLDGAAAGRRFAARGWE